MNNQIYNEDLKVHTLNNRPREYETTVEALGWEDN